MQSSRMSLPPPPGVGEVATFYSYDASAMRSMALANIAVLLAGREDATVPVLMIDWDIESPSLHHVFDQRDEHIGLLELFEACRDTLQALGQPPAAPDDVALAQQVLDAVDWPRYVQRIDQSRSLYLLRAGCFDADYGRRASQFDWDALYGACPALFRCFAQQLGRQFRHVLIDARSGRSSSVSICTTLLPSRLVTLFTPSQRSLDGLEGVVGRALQFRRSHEEEQRPLLVYPVPCSMDSADSERRRQWRHGDAAHGLPGYQSTLERMLRQLYGLPSVSLDSYFDEVQVQQTRTVALALHDEHGGDRFSLTRSFEALLDWLADGYFPWQSRAELVLEGAVRALRGRADDPNGRARAVPLAEQLHALGTLHRACGRQRQALACFQECSTLRLRVLGDGHPDTLAARESVAMQLRDCGKLAEARTHYESLAADCAALQGGEHLATLAARAGLASTLALQNQFGAALELEQSVTASYERQLGPQHLVTLESVARQADILSRQGELSHSRSAWERVVDGRRRQLGSEHDSTLQGKQQLALVLCRLGDLEAARQAQERVVGARLRHGRLDQPATVDAHEVLASIMAEQGDLPSLQQLQEALAGAGEGQRGQTRGATLAARLWLAATLGQQGELEAARRLHSHISRLAEHLRHGADGGHGKPPFADAQPPCPPPPDDASDQSAALRALEQAVLQASERLRQFARDGSGSAQEAHAAALGLRQALAAAHETEQADALNGRIDELQQLIDSERLSRARDLADSLRKPLLRPGVAQRLRLRGLALVRRIYRLQGDQAALLALHQAEGKALDDPLSEVQAVDPL